MTDAEKIAAARELLNNPLTELLLMDLETSAVNACVNAPVKDHEARAAHAAEVRAVRSFRQKLTLLTREANQARKAPA